MPLRTLRLLAGLAAAACAASARGARLLDLLSAAAAAAAGDPAVRPRLQALLAAAAAPYFRCGDCVAPVAGVGCRSAGFAAGLHGWCTVGTCRGAL